MLKFNARGADPSGPAADIAPSSGEVRSRREPAASVEPADEFRREAVGPIRAETDHDDGGTPEPGGSREDDDTLCQQAAQGNREAEEALVLRYRQLVRACARPFFLAGGDSEDLIQEGMVGLLMAIREYDAEKAASFRTFAELCVRRRLYSVLRAAARDKRRALNQSISLNAPGFDSSSCASGPRTMAQRNPEEFLIDREYTAALLSGVRKQLSALEAVILGYYLDGLTCGEIARLSGRPLKSVDNAVQRIRRKVARQIQTLASSSGAASHSGDFSES